MADPPLALIPVNSQGGAILTVLFPVLLFAVVAVVLWGSFAGWDAPLSRRFRPAWIHRFQTAIAEADPVTSTAPPPAPGPAPAPPPAPGDAAPADAADPAGGPAIDGSAGDASPGHT
jgi:hypothetical protein